MFILSDLTNVTGYVMNVSSTKTSASQKRYFDFTIATEGKTVRCVCFDMDKRKIIASLSDSQTKGIAATNAVKSHADILIVQDTILKEVKPNFTKSVTEEPMSTLAHIFNASADYTRVSVGVKVFNIGPITECVKDGCMLKCMSASVTDNSGYIRHISFFGEQITQIKNLACYHLTNVMVTRYMSKKVLKTTTQTKITELPEDSITASVDSDVLQSVNAISGTIVSVDMSTLRPSYQCIGCRGSVEPEDGIIFFSQCKVMSDASGALLVSS